MVHDARTLIRGLALTAVLSLLVLTRPAAAGPQVIAGETTPVAGYLQAGSSGATFELGPGVTVYLTPGTEARFMPTQSLSLPTQGLSRVHTVVLRSGQADIVLAGALKARDAVLVATLDRLTGIAMKGEATFRSEGRGLVIANVDGAVLGPKQGGWESVPRFEQRHYVHPDQAPTVAPTAAAPSWAKGRVLLIAAGATAEVGPITWSAVPAAQQYEVEVTTGAGHVSRVRATKTQLPAGVLVPRGASTLRCRAVDASGVAGRWSSALPVRVAGVVVPPGAVVNPDGSVALGAGQTVAFEGADGLVMWHHATRRTQPSSLPVGLNEGRRTLVALREPGSLDFALLRLVPRRASAIVEVGPKDVVWPHDVVELKYRLLDGASAVEAGTERVAVTLDARPLEVTWQRSGAWMTARVRPQTGCGRCVLRLEVSDQNGVALGRDFVEIVELGTRKIVAEQD